MLLENDSSMQRSRIFYVSLIETNTGWGAEYFLNHALVSQGHTTVCLDYKRHWDRLEWCFRNAPPSDVLFLQRGENFPVDVVRLHPGPRVFWASELLSRRSDQDELIRSGLFDHVFFHSRACVETAERKGWLSSEKASVLLNGFDARLFRPLPLAKDIDVLFVGYLTPRRRSHLQELSKSFHVVFGNAFGEELASLINRARVVLNIHAEDYLDTETRIFEVLGCGAFCLSEPLSSENPFGPEALVQCPMESFKETIAYYLAHDTERQGIARNGYRQARKMHTYGHRAKEISAVFHAHLHHRESQCASE